MRIGIDARSILSPEKGDAIGVGHYTYQLIRHLLEMDKENEYVLFFDWRVREKDVKKFTRPNTTIRFYPFSDYKKYLPGVYNEILGAATLSKEKLDVLHSTSPESRIPASYRGKTVVTFHDMSAFSVPEYLSAAKRTRSKALTTLMAKKADRVIAVSESLQKELERYLEVSPEKTQVIHSGIDKRFFEPAEASSQKILAKFGIEKKYVLFLGTLEPTKNIGRILEAFAALKKKAKESGKKWDWQLVLAGKSGWLAPHYPQLVRDLGLAKDVIFTGYVIGDELVPLFRGAQLFVMPSLYEGFGMTLLEAFATETPAIVSETASLPEIAQDAAYFVNPASSGAIADAMELFMNDDGLRENYRGKGLERARQFSWEETARKTLEVYKKVAAAQ